MLLRERRQRLEAVGQAVKLAFTSAAHDVGETGKHRPAGGGVSLGEEPGVDRGLDVLWGISREVVVDGRVGRGGGAGGDFCPNPRRG